MVKDPNTIRPLPAHPCPSNYLREGRRRVIVTLPDYLFDKIIAEATLTGRSPGSIIVEWLESTLA